MPSKLMMETYTTTLCKERKSPVLYEYIVSLYSEKKKRSLQIIKHMNSGIAINLSVACINFYVS